MNWWYIVLINIAAYVIYRKDKMRALEGGWRISESTLLLLAIIGGAVGASLAMKFYRHKTQKPVFKIVTLLGYLQFFIYAGGLLVSLGIIPLRYIT